MTIQMEPMYVCNQTSDVIITWVINGPHVDWGGLWRMSPDGTKWRWSKGWVSVQEGEW